MVRKAALSRHGQLLAQQFAQRTVPDYVMLTTPNRTGTACSVRSFKTNNGLTSDNVGLRIMYLMFPCVRKALKAVLRG